MDWGYWIPVVLGLLSLMSIADSLQRISRAMGNK